MSRIGQKLVTVPSTVTVVVDDGHVVVKGGKGESSVPFPDCLKVTVADGKVRGRTRQ